MLGIVRFLLISWEIFYVQFSYAFFPLGRAPYCSNYCRKNLEYISIASKITECIVRVCAFDNVHKMYSFAQIIVSALCPRHSPNEDIRLWHMCLTSLFKWLIMLIYLNRLVVLGWLFLTVSAWLQNLPPSSAGLAYYSLYTI